MSAALFERENMLIRVANRINVFRWLLAASDFSVRVCEETHQNKWASLAAGSGECRVFRARPKSALPVIDGGRCGGPSPASLRGVF
jgi:hypothetical protein